MPEVERGTAVGTTTLQLRARDFQRPIGFSAQSTPALLGYPTFGSIGPRLPDVRSDGLRNLDFGVSKNITFALAGREGNVRQANNPRFIQFGLKIGF